MEVRVDRAACRGSRACTRRAPGTFSIDAEGRSIVAQRPTDTDETIREAADACPFFAIEVRETGPT